MEGAGVFDQGTNVSIEQQPPAVLALILADYVHRDDPSGTFTILANRRQGVSVDSRAHIRLCRPRRILLIPLENPDRT